MIRERTRWVLPGLGARGKRLSRTPVKQGVAAAVPPEQGGADAPLTPNAMADVGLNPADIDGVATADETPVTITHHLGIPKWVNGTAVGGCSFVIQVRHAAAVIASGRCDTALITHGGSSRSGVGRTRNVVAPTGLAGQLEQPYGPMGPSILFIAALHEDLCDGRATGDGSVVQREWAAKNPRATLQDASASRASRGRLAIT